MAEDDQEKQHPGRRDVIKGAVAVAAVGGTAAALSANEDMVWQIDPEKCTWCGRCATECVVQPSAVRCQHAYQMCGYCELCFGYFEPAAVQLNEAAENQVCPTAALLREFVEDPYYEYHVDREHCIGCARCVAGCTSFGNGSLYLQIQRDLCVNCNECQIGQNCPGDAIKLIPASQAYIPKGKA
jgi:Na+-translocating ferredoxin:NAD+ oxidoreductase subunit B